MARPLSGLQPVDSIGAMKTPRTTRSATAVVGALLALAACSGSADPSGPAAISHVHGLGVNPADDTLYAATHTGVFRVTKGRAELIADRQQDTMAFTVTGPDEFIAGGHPAPGEGPNPLGLIRSTDAARTWTAVAFAGEADFHAIDVAAVSTYAYAGGSLIRSQDREKWTSVAELAVYDIAADPASDVALLLTTATGELTRLTVGSTPKIVDGAPTMGPIDWAEDGVVVGLGAEGEVQVSTDGGLTWERRADLPGASEAVTAAKGRWFVATTEGIYLSTDDGTSWTPFLR